MPAWSEPGSHSVGRPRIRAFLAMMSCSVTNIACPMCSAPVTFGGGIAIVNGSPVASSEGLKHPCDSHHSYRRSSVAPCSKFFGRSAWFAPGEIAPAVGEEEEEETEDAPRTIAARRERWRRRRRCCGWRSAPVGAVDARDASVAREDARAKTAFAFGVTPHRGRSAIAIAGRSMRACRLE
jgi:hypothetical protein